jgi:predicted transglutaminase-like cysteine proteinase
MKWSIAEGLGASLAGIALAGTLALVPAQAASERALFISVGPTARAPVGWSEFCAEHASECETTARTARDAALTNQAWNELVRINQMTRSNR